MLPLDKKWQIAIPLPIDAEKSLSKFPSLIRQILYNRGYTTINAADKYLEAMLPQNTHPFGILNISEAVCRIKQARKRNEQIAVYGDYDADGVTATVLMVQVLERLNAQVIGYIPNRFDEGYGLNIEALKSLQSQGVSLIITVDCGIRSLEEAEYAKKLGVDLIICDHHHPGKELPQAIAVINPKRPGDAYPEKDLAGVGLAYKLAQAVLYDGNKINLNSTQRLEIRNYLDLVAIGTVADLVPLIGENRALVRTGLQEIMSTRRQGLYSLLMVTGLNRKCLTAGDIGYILGPRLNAAGRLDTAQSAFELLMTEDHQIAGLLAQKLETQNQERQKLTLENFELAQQIIELGKPDKLLLFAVHPKFNQGVVGLVASRLADRYYRPAIVAQQGEIFTHGSCRSIPEFHITNALDQCSDLFEHHGGHAAAAGFTIHNKHLPDLVERLQIAADQELGSLDLSPTIFADAEVHLSELKPDLFDYLDRIQPTGYGNQEAIFVSRQLRVIRSHVVGKNNDHLRLSVTDGKITYDAIAFNFGYWQDQLPVEIDLLFTFEKNEWNGRENLQLNVKDLKPSQV